MFQKLRHSDTCNQAKSCTKHGRPDQSQRELTIVLNSSITFLTSTSRNTRKQFNYWQWFLMLQRCPIMQCTHLPFLSLAIAHLQQWLVISSVTLTDGNWQKWKRVGLFLTCPCHEIYRDEAVGLKSCKNTWKITIFVKMWNLGQYRENLIFCQ